MNNYAAQFDNLPHKLYILSTMPRVAASNKQKNKKFKGAGKGKKQAHIKQKSKTKGIAKVRNTKKPTKIQRIKQQKEKKERQVNSLTAANEYLDAKTKQVVSKKLKTQNQSRVILLIPCNQHADVNSLINIFSTYLEEQRGFVLRKDLKACSGFPAFQVFPDPNVSIIKNRLFVIGSQKQPKQLIDLAKCADIICPVVSVMSANPQRIVQDPFNYAGAFDEAGYTIINLLRSLGLSRVVGLIQHLQKIEHKHQDKISKFYKRFLTSEFGEERIMAMQTNNDISTLFRTLDSCGLVRQSWKEERGYLLADQVEVNEQGSVMVSGFLKGNCINSNQIVHVTGLDDFHIDKIQILTVGTRAKLSMEVQNSSDELFQYPTIPEDLNPFSKPENMHEDEQFLNALEGLKLEQQLQHHSEDQMNQEQQSDGEANWQDQAQEFNENKADEKAKRVEMQMRKQDELQFEDEVEYAAQEILKEKYREYQGLKNFKSSSWNQLQNLPTQYDRIYFFKHYSQTHHAAVKDNVARGFAYPGFYVRITIKDLQIQKLTEQVEKLPLVLSFLLKHQRKMTVLHGKIQKNPFYQGEHKVNSGQLVMISIGFKRLLVQPIYSRCINGTQKTKYTKAIGEDYQNHYFCSFYHHNYFPPSPFLVFRVNHLNTNQIQAAPILRGDLVKCDPMHVILERIILTGYPYKINRRRATVRYMFFNPGDVKYFKPIEIKTKMGLRGKIEESLGTHGLMKCFFNDPIKHNDTVCMHLYRRMYPPSHF